MKRKLFWQQVLILALAAIISMGVFIIFSSQMYRTGYPLDDAWIHQTFARNLIKYHQLTYFEGIPSTGSTAPLWTLLLSFGYFISENNYVWTMILGFISLTILGWQGEYLFRHISNEYSSVIPWVGILIIFEWHFIWAASSGMETLMLADISLAVFSVLLNQRINWFLAGLLVGVGVWIRPDALLLMGPILFAFGLEVKKKRAGFREAGKIFLGVGIFVIPYLTFNQTVSGNYWPNTFYAKQLEYRELLAKPFVNRVWNVFQQHIVGMGILLLPGFFYKLWDSIKKREWVLISFVIWWFGFLLVYAMRLPVDYQHGRYQIPVMPLFLLISGSGVFMIWKHSIGRKIPRILSTAWGISIILLNTGFFWLGARTYANDVSIIETEMVDTAWWIYLNTSESSLVAAHDIGALGFFGGREILDLAGLVSPKVLPVIRDEQGLFAMIKQSDADYLMTFPDWYPKITSGLVPIFISDGRFSPASGGENMTVYRIEQD
jgi:hypothetical protein